MTDTEEIPLPEDDVVDMDAIDEERMAIKETSDSEVDFWDGCFLIRYLTDPPTYGLKVPNGTIIKLTSSSFFDVKRFTIAFVDKMGYFPPLPKKKPSTFLCDLFRRLLEGRRDVEIAYEAGDDGMIESDVRQCIFSCPQTDDPFDIDRGAALVCAEGAMISARCLMAKVQRFCPVKITPSTFFKSLVSIGLKNLGPRSRGGWQGRVWLVPFELLPHQVEQSEPTTLPDTPPQQLPMYDVATQSDDELYV